MRRFFLVLAIAIAIAAPLAAFGQDAQQREYVLRDNGVRCRAAPCASMDAVAVAGGEVIQVTGYDAGALNLPPAAREALQDDLYHGRLVVLGRLRVERTARVLIIDRLVRRAPNADPPKTILPRP